MNTVIHIHYCLKMDVTLCDCSSNVMTTFPIMSTFSASEVAVIALSDTSCAIHSLDKCNFVNSFPSLISMAERDACPISWLRRFCHSRTLLCCFLDSRKSLLVLNNYTCLLSQFVHLND